MSTEVKVPVLPESVSDATIATWHKKAGEAVKRDENLVDLETDKVVLEVPSPVDGVLKELKFQTGDTVNSQQVIASHRGRRCRVCAGTRPGLLLHRLPPRLQQLPRRLRQGFGRSLSGRSARRHRTEHRPVQGRRHRPRWPRDQGRPGELRQGRRSRRCRCACCGPTPGSRPEERVPMTRIRARIAERLMQSKNSIAMLTSFNEVNLAEVTKMRKTLGEQFEKANGVKLGFMSFFVKAAAEALKRHPSSTRRSMVTTSSITATRTSPSPCPPTRVW
jgi:2-oxoglutarate dehydrogenase E2 component (dihydrolipoamide succinyltransferase)